MAAVALEAFDAAVERMIREMEAMAEKQGAKTRLTLAEDLHSGFWLRVGNLARLAAQGFPGVISAKLNYPIAAWAEVAAFAEGVFSARGVEWTLLAHAGVGVSRMDLLLPARRGRAGPPGGGGCPGTAARSAAGRPAETWLSSRAPPEAKPALPVWGAAGGDAVVVERLKKQLDPVGVMSPGRFVGGL